jgi:glycosyltransferase involved in cell wall biosynthesis
MTTISRKTKILHYGSAPIAYGSPSFYKFIELIRLGNKSSHNILEFYPKSIFDVESFTWLKRLCYTISFKKIYLIDFIELTFTLMKKAMSKDIIVVLGFPALWEFILLMLIARIRKIPIFVIETHWYWPQTRLSRILWFVYVKLLKHVDGLLCPGLASYKYWENFGFDNVHIVHYYALEAFMAECAYNEDELRRKLGVKDDEIVILYLGRLIKKKGVHNIIFAFHKCVSNNPSYRVKLLVAGEGPERRNLEKLCDQLGIRRSTLFIGPVPERWKKCLYKLAHIFAYVPVIEEIPEEWPIAPLEAMSLGIPTIISTAVGSLPDIRNGVFVVKWDDIEDLYKAMKALVENKVLRKQLSKRAIKVYHQIATKDNAKLEFLKAIHHAGDRFRRRSVRGVWSRFLRP